MKKKIDGWSTRFLSHGGKEIFIKSVLQAIPTYFMACFLLPKSLCGEMENIVARFKWQKDHGRRGPTFSDLYYKRLVSNLLCPRCSIDVENVDHVFRGCPVSKEL
ncbi:hypothetical protein V6Z11_A08G099300 [Gossypium hirsutum]